MFSTQDIDTDPVEHASILELKREPIVRQPDSVPRRRRVLAGKDLVCRYRAGLLKDRGQVADLLALTSLFATDDHLFAEA